MKYRPATARVLTLVASLASALTVISCSGTTTQTPTPSPTPQPPSVSTITIFASADYVLTGQSMAMIALGTEPSGSTVPVAALWQSDSVAATIDGNGTLIGRRQGTATITATYQSATARRTVQIINNFVGTWIGNGRITGCDAAGDFVTSKFCDTFPLNTIQPVTLTLSQNGDAVSGSLVLGSINGLMTGSVDNLGQYIASGTGTGARENVVLTYTIGGFVGQANGSESIVWWAMNVVAPGWRGNAYVKVNSDILRKSGPLSIVP